MNIGETIKFLRIDHDLTQKELANAIGASRQATISDIESGRREPTAGELERIAKVLNTTVHFLITRTDPQNITLAEETGLSNDSIIILRELKKNKPESSLRITALIHALLTDEALCLLLSDYLYREYDAFSGMMSEDKEYMLSLFGENSLREMIYFADLEPAARLRVMDHLKKLREGIQHGQL